MPALTLALLLTWLLMYLTVQAQSDPSAAQNLRAEVLPGEGVALSWDAPAEDAESITGYEILRRRPNRGENSLLSYVGDTGSDATNYTDLERLLEADAARVLLKEVVDAARRRRLSADHFTVDGTLLEAWASHKSYRPRDEQPPQGGGRNRDADFPG